MAAQSIKALKAENNAITKAHQSLQKSHDHLQSNNDHLENNNHHLQKNLTSLERKMRFALAKIAKYEEEIRLARAERFAANSEQSPQYALFNEAEETQIESVEDLVEAEQITVPAHARKVPKRKPLPEDLPRIIVEHDLVDKRCACGAEKVRIGTKTSKQLDVIPAQVFVIEHHCHSYKCTNCEDAAPETAPLPAQPIPKSFASPGLLAHVAISKYADGLPLYRQSKMFERMGIDLPRQTLASHMVRAGELVRPLIECMTQHGLQHDVLQMDETRVQVLDEDNRRAKNLSWMWVIRGGPPDKPVINFNYDQSRAGSVAKQLLDGYQGYLQTDGYKAYGKVLATPGIEGLGCWAHVRRKFFKAQQAQPGNKPSARLHQILSWIGKLYALEKQWLLLDPESRKLGRIAQSKPLLDQIETWMAKQDVNPQSLLGRATTYMKNEWPRLIIYIKDGRLNIDNNLVENAIRPFALGRKNWLFSQSVEGARSSAALYSLVETARANGINPYAYLKHVFTVLPGVIDEREMDQLLPWNMDASVLDDYLVPVKT